MGAAWANAIAYAIQALLAYRSRSASIRSSTKRDASSRVTAAALAACLIARRASRHAADRGRPRARRDGGRGVCRLLLRPGSSGRTNCGRWHRCGSARDLPRRRRFRRSPSWPARSSRPNCRWKKWKQPSARAGGESQGSRHARARRDLRDGARASRHRTAIRAAGRLQPRRSRDHGARAQLREGHAEPAQLSLSDVLLLRALRLGGCLSRCSCSLTGQVESIAALQRLYFTAPTGIYTAGRALGAACGTATVALLHRLTLRFADPRAALAAAVFLAVAPLHVRDSHYVKHDVPATLAIVVAYLAYRSRCGRRQRADGPPWHATRCLPAPRAVWRSRTHYYCVFLAAPLAWAVVARHRNDGVGAIVRGLASLRQRAR